MTYQVLARKWRPRSFDTLVGQDHVVRALTHALATQRLHHAWLFTGTRGVGKTTLSRILAKSLNCEAGVTATPCGVCRACTEIDTGRFVDYVELDAASNRGVDEMTQLLEQAVYAPSSGRFKVYMIDEVHMLTGHAFNAMLKTLEEPPPHVKFILATTDPQKIPVTVLSRCLQFNLKQMTAESIVAHLQDVLGQEAIPFETPALRLLAKAASGSMRDALSLTDQAIAYSAGDLTAQSVQGMLGAIDQRHLVDLLTALADGATTRVLAVADELASRGLSYTGALADLAILLSRIAIEQRVPGALPEDDPQAEDIAHLAQRLHPDQVQLFYSVSVHSRQELSLAPDEYAGFVMACLRMVSLAPPGAVPPPSPPASRGDAACGRASSPEEGRGGASPAPQPAQPAPAQRLDNEQAQKRQSMPGAPGEPLRVDHAQAAQPSRGDRPSQADPSPRADRSSQSEPSLQPQSLSRIGQASRPQPAEPSPPAVAGRGVAALEAAVQGGEDNATVEVPAWEDLPEHRLSDASPVAGEPAVALGRLVDDAAVAVTQPDAASAAFAENDQGAPAAAETRNAAPDDEFETLDLPDYEASYDDTRFEPADDYGSADFAGLGDILPDAFAMDAPRRRSGKSARLSDMTSPAWPAFAASLPLTGLASELARQSEWVGVRDGMVHLRVAIRTLADTSAKSRVQTVLSEHFGQVVNLAVEYGATGDETAHAVELAQRAQRQKDAEQAVRADPFIHILKTEFNAAVVHDSIRAAPLNKAA